jgi:hypothetical protein
MYVSENQTLNWIERRLIKTVEIKFLRVSRRRLCDYEHSITIRIRLKIMSSEERTEENENKWNKHSMSMEHKNLQDIGGGGG